jgi:CubicO group peptidase (beta-lactamase class C family)
MTRLEERRRFLSTALGGSFIACGGAGLGSNPQPSPVSDRQIRNAVGQLDTLTQALMTSTGVPGMAVALVRGTQTIYAKGFGTRLVGSDTPVDADTVFQLASLSKSVGSSVVAHQVGVGNVSWDTTIRTHLPWFTLSNADADASNQVTIADLYSHRSGLPDHAGDRLEDMGYGRREVLERLRFLPLHPFRNSYFYTNFGLTAAAESVAAASGLDWATLCDVAIYRPLGMTSTSSRYADFAARANRAFGHVKVGDKWLQGPGTMPDAQAPAGGVSSSVNDMAKWLAMMLGQGVFNGKRIVDATALAAAVTPQVQSVPPGFEHPASYYGYGFNAGTTSAGRAFYSHSGAFVVGASTNFVVVPSTGLGIVALTNGFPIGIPEALTAQFFDLVQFGSIQRDWTSLYSHALAPLHAPEGVLAGVTSPSAPLPARALSFYAGTYQNDYFGPLRVIAQGETLALAIGPKPMPLALTHWDGDVFTFTLRNENANPGTISKATFSSNSVTLEYYDEDRVGTFVR